MEFRYGRHSVVTSRWATSTSFRMRQNCMCSPSKIQVLWHDSKIMASTTQRWLDALNPSVEEPGDRLWTSLQLNDAQAPDCPFRQEQAGEIPVTRA
jgi:hypothetical protein